MFTQEQLNIIYQLLANLNFKVNEIEFAIKVRETLSQCEINLKNLEKT